MFCITTNISWICSYIFWSRLFQMSRYHIFFMPRILMYPWVVLRSSYNSSLLSNFLEHETDHLLHSKMPKSYESLCSITFNNKGFFIFVYGRRDCDTCILCQCIPFTLCLLFFISFQLFSSVFHFFKSHHSRWLHVLAMVNDWEYAISFWGRPPLGHFDK